MDIRNTLFGGSGVMSLAGQKIFGKGYSPLEKASGILSSSPTSASSGANSQGITDLLASSDRQEALLKVISKNTFNMNMMARDTNITRQNIITLTKKVTGQSSRSQDALWNDVRTRNYAIDSMSKKKNENAQPGNTSPSNTGGSSSFLGSIMSGLGTIASLGGGILGGLFGVISRMSPILAIVGLAGAAYVIKQIASQVDFTGLKKSIMDAIGLDSESDEPILKQLAKKLDSALGLDSKPFGSFYEFLEKSPFMIKLGEKINLISTTALDYTKAAFQTLANGFGRVGEIFSYYFGEFFHANKGLILGVMGASIGSLLGIKGAAAGALIGAIVGAATGNKDLAGLTSELFEKQTMLDKLITDRDNLQKNEANLSFDDKAKLNDYRSTTGVRGKSIKQLEDRIGELQIKIGTKKEEQEKLMDFSPNSVFKDELKKLQQERADKEAEAKSPVKVSSPFGMRTHPITGRQMMHEGVDAPMKEGADVYAAEKGTVKISGAVGNYGNMIEIDHGNGKTTRYGHLKSMNVAVGDMVERGQKIALAGNTGSSTGPHLHFEERENGRATRPSAEMLATAVRGQMLNDNSVLLAAANRQDNSSPNINVVNTPAAAPAQPAKPQNAVASVHNFDPWVEIWGASILNPAKMGM